MRPSRAPAGRRSASATASALRFQSSCSADGCRDAQHVQRVDAVEIRTGQRIAILQRDGVLEQGNRRGLVAAGVARAAPFQQIADAHAHRHLVQLRHDGVQCRIGVGELPPQTLRARDLRRRLDGLARTCRVSRKLGAKARLRFRGLAELPQLVEMLGKIVGQGLAHGDGGFQQRNEQGQQQHQRCATAAAGAHEFFPGGGVPRRARARARAAATTACRRARSSRAHCPT